MQLVSTRVSVKMDVLLCIVLGLLVLYYIFGSKSRLGKPIPGPSGWPLVGMGFNITPETLYHKLTQYAGQYGDIFRINVFGINLVVLNSAEYVRKAFNCDPYKQFMNDRSGTFFGDRILFGGQSIAFTKRAYGSPHGGMRKGFTRAMHAYGDGKKEFEDKVKTELDHLVDTIDAYNGKEFDIEALIKRSLMNLISLVLAGRNLRNEEDDFKMFWDFDRATDFLVNQRVDALLRAFPFIRFIPSIYRERYEEIVGSTADITKKYFSEVKATHKPDMIRGIVDSLIDEQLQAKENGNDVIFTDERIIATILESIAAGVLTTLGMICSIVLCLLNHPEYQKKIQAELDKVIGKDRLPSFPDKQSCPVTEAVIMETGRYITTVPGLLGHYCRSNIEFEGYDIEANSRIIANVWYIHHDEKIWGDPWTFRPERWLTEKGEILPNDHPLRKSWLPFGTGRRQCIGESFARSRVFLYVARLLQRWTLELPPGSYVPCDPRVGNFHFATTCRPKAFHCRVLERA